jgi:PTS system mannose-specific IID component
MSAPAQLPFGVRLAILVRLLAVQGAWNYETLMGNGIAFAMEPGLRLLPGGGDGEPFRAAMARHAAYFNAHPYLAGVAVGALVRAELEGEDVGRIERFRTACCGPLGSVGDRLVWAGWLPACSLVALGVFGAGGSPLAVVLTFIVLYNLGHLGLRLWGLHAGYRDGLKVANALGNPLLRNGPAAVARIAAFTAGLVWPFAMRGMVGPARGSLVFVLASAVAGAFVVTRLQGRVEGWRVAIAGLAGLILFSVVR